MYPSRGRRQFWKPTAMELPRGLGIRNEDTGGSSTSMLGSTSGSTSGRGTENYHGLSYPAEALRFTRPMPKAFKATISAKKNYNPQQHPQQPLKARDNEWRVKEQEPVIPKRRSPHQPHHRLHRPKTPPKEATSSSSPSSSSTADSTHSSDDALCSAIPQRDTAFRPVKKDALVKPSAPTVKKPKTKQRVNDVPEKYLNEDAIVGRLRTNSKKNQSSNDPTGKITGQQLLKELLEWKRATNVKTEAPIDQTGTALKGKMKTKGNAKQPKPKSRVAAVDEKAIRRAKRDFLSEDEDEDEMPRQRHHSATARKQNYERDNSQNRTRKQNRGDISIGDSAEITKIREYRGVRRDNTRKQQAIYPEEKQGKGLDRLMHGDKSKAAYDFDQALLEQILNPSSMRLQSSQSSSDAATQTKHSAIRKKRKKKRMANSKVSPDLNVNLQMEGVTPPVDKVFDVNARTMEPIWNNTCNTQTCKGISNQDQNSSFVTGIYRTTSHRTAKESIYASGISNDEVRPELAKSSSVRVGLAPAIVDTIQIAFVPARVIAVEVVQQSLAEWQLEEERLINMQKMQQRNEVLKDSLVDSTPDKIKCIQAENMIQVPPKIATPANIIGEPHLNNSVPLPATVIDDKICISPDMLTEMNRMLAYSDTINLDANQQAIKQEAIPDGHVQISSNQLAEMNRMFICGDAGNLAINKPTSDRAAVLVPSTARDDQLRMSSDPLPELHRMFILGDADKSTGTKSAVSPAAPLTAEVCEMNRLLISGDAGKVVAESAVSPDQHDTNSAPLPSTIQDDSDRMSSDQLAEMNRMIVYGDAGKLVAPEPVIKEGTNTTLLTGNEADFLGNKNIAELPFIVQVARLAELHGIDISHLNIPLFKHGEGMTPPQPAQALLADSEGHKVDASKGTVNELGTGKAPAISDIQISIEPTTDVTEQEKKIDPTPPVVSNTSCNSKDTPDTFLAKHLLSRLSAPSTTSSSSKEIIDPIRVKHLSKLHQSSTSSSSKENVGKAVAKNVSRLLTFTPSHTLVTGKLSASDIAEIEGMANEDVINLRNRGLEVGLVPKDSYQDAISNLSFSPSLAFVTDDPSSVTLVSSFTDMSYKQSMTSNVPTSKEDFQKDKRRYDARKKSNDHIAFSTDKYLSVPTIVKEQTTVKKRSATSLMPSKKPELVSPSISSVEPITEEIGKPAENETECLAHPISTPNYFHKGTTAIKSKNIAKNVLADSVKASSVSADTAVKKKSPRMSPADLTDKSTRQENEAKHRPKSHSHSVKLEKKILSASHKEKHKRLEVKHRHTMNNVAMRSSLLVPATVPKYFSTEESTDAIESSYPSLQKNIATEGSLSSLQNNSSAQAAEAIWQKSIALNIKESTDSNFEKPTPTFHENARHKTLNLNNEGHNLFRDIVLERKTPVLSQKPIALSQNPPITQEQDTHLQKATHMQEPALNLLGPRTYHKDPTTISKEPTSLSTSPHKVESPPLRPETLESTPLTGVTVQAMQNRTKPPTLPRHSLLKRGHESPTKGKLICEENLVVKSDSAVCGSTTPSSATKLLLSKMGHSLSAVKTTEPVKQTEVKTSASLTEPQTFNNESVDSLSTLYAATLEKLKNLIAERTGASTSNISIETKTTSVAREKSESSSEVPCLPAFPTLIIKVSTPAGSKENVASTAIESVSSFAPLVPSSLGGNLSFSTIAGQRNEDPLSTVDSVTTNVKTVSSFAPLVLSSLGGNISLATFATTDTSEVLSSVQSLPPSIAMTPTIITDEPVLKSDCLMKPPHSPSKSVAYSSAALATTEAPSDVSNLSAYTPTLSKQPSSAVKFSHDGNRTPSGISNFLSSTEGVAYNLHTAAEERTSLSSTSAPYAYPNVDGQKVSISTLDTMADVQSIPSFAPLVPCELGGNISLSKVVNDSSKPITISGDDFIPAGGATDAETSTLVTCSVLENTLKYCPKKQISLEILKKLDGICEMPFSIIVPEVGHSHVLAEESDPPFPDEQIASQSTDISAANDSGANFTNRMSSFGPLISSKRGGNISISTVVKGTTPESMTNKVAYQENVNKMPNIATEITEIKPRYEGQSGIDLEAQELSLRMGCQILTDDSRDLCCLEQNSTVVLDSTMSSHMSRELETDVQSMVPSYTKPNDKATVEICYQNDKQSFSLCNDTALKHIEYECFAAGNFPILSKTESIANDSKDNAMLERKKLEQSQDSLKEMESRLRSLATYRALAQGKGVGVDFGKIGSKSLAHTRKHAGETYGNNESESSDPSILYNESESTEANCHKLLVHHSPVPVGLHQAQTCSTENEMALSGLGKNSSPDESNTSVALELFNRFVQLQKVLKRDVDDAAEQRGNGSSIRWIEEQSDTNKGMGMCIDTGGWSGAKILSGENMMQDFSAKIEIQNSETYLSLPNGNLDAFTTIRSQSCESPDLFSHGNVSDSDGDETNSLVPINFTQTTDAYFQNLNVLNDQANFDTACRCEFETKKNEGNSLDAETFQQVTADVLYQNVTLLDERVCPSNKSNSNLSFIDGTNVLTISTVNQPKNTDFSNDPVVEKKNALVPETFEPKINISSKNVSSFIYDDDVEQTNVASLNDRTIADCTAKVGEKFLIAKYHMCPELQQSELSISDIDLAVSPCDADKTSPVLQELKQDNLKLLNATNEVLPRNLLLLCQENASAKKSWKGSDALLPSLSESPKLGLSRIGMFQSESQLSGLPDTERSLDNVESDTNILKQTEEAETSSLMDIEAETSTESISQYITPRTNSEKPNQVIFEKVAPVKTDAIELSSSSESFQLKGACEAEKQRELINAEMKRPSKRQWKIDPNTWPNESIVAYSQYNDADLTEKGDDIGPNKQCLTSANSEPTMDIDTETSTESISKYIGQPAEYELKSGCEKRCDGQTNFDSIYKNQPHSEKAGADVGSESSCCNKVDLNLDCIPTEYTKSQALFYECDTSAFHQHALIREALEQAIPVNSLVMNSTCGNEDNDEIEIDRTSDLQSNDAVAYELAAQAERFVFYNIQPEIIKGEVYNGAKKCDDDEQSSETSLQYSMESVDNTLETIEEEDEKVSDTLSQKSYTSEAKSLAPRPTDAVLQASDRKIEISTDDGTETISQPLCFIKKAGENNFDDSRLDDKPLCHYEHALESSEIVSDNEEERPPQSQSSLKSSHHSRDYNAPPAETSCFAPVLDASTDLILSDTDDEISSFDDSLHEHGTSSPEVNQKGPSQNSVSPLSLTLSMNKKIDRNSLAYDSESQKSARYSNGIGMSKCGELPTAEPLEKQQGKIRTSSETLSYCSAKSTTKSVCGDSRDADSIKSDVIPSDGELETEYSIQKNTLAPTIKKQTTPSETISAMLHQKMDEDARIASELITSDAEITSLNMQKPATPSQLKKPRCTSTASAETENSEAASIEKSRTPTPIGQSDYYRGSPSVLPNLTGAKKPISPSPSEADSWSSMQSSKKSSKGIAYVEAANMQSDHHVSEPEGNSVSSIPRAAALKIREHTQPSDSPGAISQKEMQPKTSSPMPSESESYSSQMSFNKIHATTCQEISATKSCLPLLETGIRKSQPPTPAGKLMDNISRGSSPAATLAQSPELLRQGSSPVTSEVESRSVKNIGSRRAQGTPSPVSIASTVLTSESASISLVQDSLQARLKPASLPSKIERPSSVSPKSISVCSPVNLNICTTPSVKRGIDSPKNISPISSTARSSITSDVNKEFSMMQDVAGSISPTSDRCNSGLGALPLTAAAEHAISNIRNVSEERHSPADEGDNAKGFHPVSPKMSLRDECLTNKNNPNTEALVAVKALPRVDLLTRYLASVKNNNPANRDDAEGNVEAFRPYLPLPAYPDQDENLDGC